MYVCECEPEFTTKTRREEKKSTQKTRQALIRNRRHKHVTGAHATRGQETVSDKQTWKCVGRCVGR